MLSRVSYGKPHTSGYGWHITLDCGHSIYMDDAPCVGARCRCAACERTKEIEGCGGDAVLDRTVN